MLRRQLHKNEFRSQLMEDMNLANMRRKHVLSPLPYNERKYMTLFYGTFLCLMPTPTP